MKDREKVIEPMPESFDTKDILTASLRVRKQFYRNLGMGEDNANWQAMEDTDILLGELKKQIEVKAP